MKFKLLLLSLILAVVTVGTGHAQFFKKSPVPGAAEFKLGAAVTPTVQNFIKPLVGVTATESNGASLGAGVGISFQHSKANVETNSWDIQYSISALAFITTNGSKIGGTGGLLIGIPGTGGLVQLGGGYDFTNKQFVALTGVGIPIF